jgi:hypothetical protein
VYAQLFAGIYCDGEQQTEFVIEGMCLAHFIVKTVKIAGDGYDLHTSILAVVVTASLADFKNVFLTIQENGMTARIREGDVLEVEL